MEGEYHMKNSPSSSLLTSSDIESIKNLKYILALQTMWK